MMTEWRSLAFVIACGTILKIYINFRPAGKIPRTWRGGSRQYFDNYNVSKV